MLVTVHGIVYCTMNSVHCTLYMYQSVLISCLTIVIKNMLVLVLERALVIYDVKKRDFPWNRRNLNLVNNSEYALQPRCEVESKEDT